MSTENPAFDPTLAAALKNLPAADSDHFDATPVLKTGGLTLGDTPLDRRVFTRGLGASLLALAFGATTSKQAEASPSQPPASTIPGLNVWARYSPLPQLVAYSGQEPAGNILVHLERRELFYTRGNGQAVKYKIASPMPGYEPKGREFTVQTIRKWPDWTPPQSVLRKAPDLVAALRARNTNHIDGGPHNPMGAAALYLLDAQGRDQGYRIHGTNDPDTIGTGSSIGCIRLHNLDLTSATNGYTDNNYRLFDMVSEAGRKVHVRVYRHGELIPGIHTGAPQAQLQR